MQNFFDIKEEKITEKAFSQGLLVSVISIVLCLVALCSMTYAWFVEDTASNANTLVSGFFTLDISVVPIDDGNLSTASEVAVIELPNEKGIYSCTLPKAGKYTVTLAPSVDSTAKGHCIIKTNSWTKHTEAIIADFTANKDGYEPNSPFVFVIETEVVGTVVEFQPIWSVVATPDIMKGKGYSADAWKIVESETTAGSETTADPETTIAPENTADPETTAGSDATVAPETTADPEAATNENP